MSSEPIAKSVQEYIDETPQWSDGTVASPAPLTAMQLRIWWLAAAGKFFEGMVVFMTGVALPLIALEFNLNATLYMLIGTSLLGAVITWRFGIETKGVNLETIGQVSCRDGR